MGAPEEKRSATRGADRSVAIHVSRSVAADRRTTPQKTERCKQRTVQIQHGAIVAVSSGPVANPEGVVTTVASEKSVSKMSPHELVLATMRVPGFMARKVGRSRR